MKAEILIKKNKNQTNTIFLKYESIELKLWFRDLEWAIKVCNDWDILISLVVNVFLYLIFFMYCQNSKEFGLS